MFWKIFKEESKALCDSIDLFNKEELAYSAINYMLIKNVVGAKIRQRINRGTAKQSTPKVNNTTLTKIKLTLHKKILFAIALLPHSSFRILSHRITLDSTLNGSNITGLQGTTNHTQKKCLVILPISKK